MCVTPVAKCQDHLGALVHATDFRLTDTAAGTLFPNAAPVKGPTHVGDCSSKEGVEFSVLASFARFGPGGILGSPVAIGVGVQAVHSGDARDSVSGPGHQGVEAVLGVEVIVGRGGWWLGEADSPVHGAFDVPEHVFGTVQVPLGRVVEVGGQQADRSCEVWAGAEADPIEASNQGLVGLDESRLVGRGFAIVGVAVNDMATAEGSPNRVSVHKVKLFQHPVYMALLGAVDGETAVGGQPPVVVDSKVVSELAHEVNGQALAQFLFEPQFGGIVGAKVHAVVHIGAKEDGATRWGSANEGTGFMGAHCQPMSTRAALKVWYQ